MLYMSVSLDVCCLFSLPGWTNTPNRYLKDHTSADIATYVTAKTHLLSTESETKTYEEFQQDIIAKAKGVFLWAILVIEEL